MVARVHGREASRRLARPDLNAPVKVLFATCGDDKLPALVEAFSRIDPGTPLMVVSEFPPPAGTWVPFHVQRSFHDVLGQCREALAGKEIRFAGLMLDPGSPYWKLRLAAALLAPTRLVCFNETFHHFMLRPGDLPVLLRHLRWRAGNWVRFQTNPSGKLYTIAWRLTHPRSLERPLVYRAALAAGWGLSVAKRWTAPRAPAPSHHQPEPGISVVIPSRDGRELLARLLPGVMSQCPDEVIVVDNGSGDGSAEWLRGAFPAVRCDVHTKALAFAEAANRGIAIARYSHVCLLNNDMLVEPGFFRALREPFDSVPGLFCATAQIFFPEGKRREETGKAVMPARGASHPPREFPVRCELPVTGEGHSYVLYGSGGCSLYDARKLGALAGFAEAFRPAYVEDLDLGYRAWQQGWPTVFAPDARVTHHHRSTTARFFSDKDLAVMVERNYFRFLARSIASPALFARLWQDSVRRLNLACAGLRPAMESDEVHVAALRSALRVALEECSEPGRPTCQMSEDQILAAGSGDIAVYAGRGRREPGPPVLIASCYAPFPLSHGGAVRMYNLMRRSGVPQLLVYFTDELQTPPEEILDLCVEVVQVRRHGSHYRDSSMTPAVVREFASEAFRAALRLSVRKWRPAIAQLEFTQMGQYAVDCAPARTILVEHDITIDLYEQLARQQPGWEHERQLACWRDFEPRVWRQADCVVTMSEKDRAMVTGGRAVVLANGVDLDRYQPGTEEPARARLLFIGSFAHLPNVLALDHFLRDVWPGLAGLDPALHVIAGARPEYYLEYYRERVQPCLDVAGVTVDAFVADVRPAYRAATVVIAPLLASAGTNIKILEAMAMGRAIVSTPAGINGLDLQEGKDVVVTRTAAAMADAIRSLVLNPEERRRIEKQARATVEARYGWDSIARSQEELYSSFRAERA